MHQITNRFRPACLACGLVVAVLFLSIAPSAAAADYTKVELQDLYMEYLKNEGYVPSIDEDGDVVFKFEGKTYFIGVDEEDQVFFRLAFANFWSIENEEERQQVLLAAQHATMSTKVAKVFIVNDNTWASIELFVGDPEDFKPIFKRSLSALQSSVATFVEKMREE